MAFEERAVVFEHEANNLYGVLALPALPCARGVVIVVGGPQYRAGSHRQFVLLARHLAGLGIPVLRFDYAGMGDSDGPVKSFEEAGSDLRAAIDQFLIAVPAVREVVLWGLCDAASAILFHGWQDPRVTGLVLLNPWVRTEAGIARATLKHYYLQRLFDPALWRKVLGGQFQLGTSLSSLVSLLRHAGRTGADNAAVIQSFTAEQGGSLPDRLYDCLLRFEGKVLVICSGADLTGQEFSDLAGGSKKWRSLMGSSRISRRDLAGADHTFSRALWRDQVAGWTAEWLDSLENRHLDRSG